MDGPIPEFPCEDLLLSLQSLTAVTNAHIQQDWKYCPSVSEVTAEGTHRCLIFHLTARPATAV